MIVVVKIGTSSVTGALGSLNADAVGKLCAEVATAKAAGHDVVVVSSGAVTAGVAALGLAGGRPTDPITLQALSSVGQHRLMRLYDVALEDVGLIAGQVLLAPLDFGVRSQYLHARATLARLLELGVVPVVNENDAVADDEIRFGDNDRLAALVANLLGAQLLVLLTDQAGLYDADPRSDPNASLVEQVFAIDEALEAAAGGPGTPGGSGGMAAKIAAARIAAWSGVRVVIANAARSGVLSDAIDGAPGVGTEISPSSRRLSARKLWIAFALTATGRVAVDAGARLALERDASLLPAGVTRAEGRFEVDEAIELIGPDGAVFAKGIARLDAERSSEWVGRKSTDLGPGLSPIVVHRDDLVLFDSPNARPLATADDGAGRETPG